MLINPEHSQITIKRSVLEGYHGLQLYANEFWLQHLLALSRDPSTCLTDMKYETLVQRLQRFCSTHEKIQRLRSHIPSLSTGLDIGSIEKDLQCLNYEFNTKKLASQLLAFRQAVENHQAKGRDFEGDKFD